MIEGPSAARGGPRPRGWQGLAARVQEAPERISRWFTPARQPADPFLARLRLADRLMWLVLGALAVFLFAELLMRPPQLPSLLSPEPLVHGGPTAAPAAVPGKPLEQLQAAVAGANPFHLSTTRSTGDLKSTSNYERLMQLVKPLIVVGVNRGATPEALIEDAEAKRTYVVKVGDMISGLTITAIGAEGVEVEYEGETFKIQ